MSGLFSSSWTPVRLGVLALALTVGACRERAATDLTERDGAGVDEPANPGEGTTTGDIVELGIVPESTTVAVGGTVTLTATAYDAREVARPADFQWLSWTPAVATVDASGLVYGVAPGRAVVRATVGTHFAQAVVIVLPAGEPPGTPGEPPGTPSEPPGTPSEPPGPPGEPPGPPGESPGATALAVSSGNGQTGAVNTTLAAPLVVRVTSGGTPAAGVTVQWAAATGNGALLPGAPVTDSAGLVSARWTLGTLAGSMRATATVAGAGSVTFTATAVPDALAQVKVSPAAANLPVGSTLRLSAAAIDRYGNAVGLTPTWSTPTPQLISVAADGLVTGLASGRGLVAASAGGMSDTAIVNVTAAPAPQPQPTRIAVSPSSATIAVAAAVQLTATVYDQNGQVMNGAAVSWASLDAGIAAVSTSGRVSGVAAGISRIVASAAAGVDDTAVVTVTTSATPPPPPPPPPSTGYARVLGDDWQGYGSNAALYARQYFYWVDATGRSVNDFVTLVSDPTFGKAVRITFPQNTGGPGSSPRLAADLPAPLDRMWFRWRMKFTPGWTTVGPDPAGSANSYKIAFWGWKNYYGRGELEYSNTADYILGTGVQDPATGSYLRYTETPLPTSASSFGQATTEWSDGEWWEFVAYYQKTGPTSARQYYWRRRLTTGGQIVDNPWVFYAYEMTGSPTPQVTSIELGINKNKNNPTDMYITWGPWDVVDGSRYPNPFGVPNVLP